jgi:hypothetical protein
MLIEIRLHENAKQGTGYHFSIHAGGATDADRVIVEYDWHDGKPSGREIQAGRLKELDRNTLQGRIQGKTAVLEAPWPLSGHNPTFFMVRAWTNIGKRTIDETAETVLTAGQTRGPGSDSAFRAPHSAFLN